MSLAQAKHPGFVQKLVDAGTSCCVSITASVAFQGLRHSEIAFQLLVNTASLRPSSNGVFAYRRGGRHATVRSDIMCIPNR
jgi:hypothetical protein